MKDYIEERVKKCANYIISTKCTVRAAGIKFNISKSSVHKDMTERLPMINMALYNEVREILNKNKSERHIRGGEATKRKYKNLK